MINIERVHIFSLTFIQSLPSMPRTVVVQLSMLTCSQFNHNLNRHIQVKISR